jgi:hypothetical protein
MRRPSASKEDVRFVMVVLMRRLRTGRNVPPPHKIHTKSADRASSHLAHPVQVRIPPRLERRPRFTRMPRASNATDSGEAIVAEDAYGSYVRGPVLEERDSRS